MSDLENKMNNSLDKMDTLLDKMLGVVNKANEDSTSHEKALDIDLVIKCPFCGSEEIEESMFIEEWDCLNCHRPFKKKDFL